MTKRVEGLADEFREAAYESEGNHAAVAAFVICADRLEQALAADRAEAGELPELPPLPEPYLPKAEFEDDYYNGTQVHDYARAYGQQCARAASCGGGEWPLGVLNRQKTLDTLRSHNEWRRGAEAPQTDPRILGLALDAVIAYLTTPPTPSAGVEVTEAAQSILNKLHEWSRAYPKDVFPEPTDDDFANVNGVFPSAVTRISASMGRHMVRLIEKDLAALTAALEGGK